MRIIDGRIEPSSTNAIHRVTREIKIRKGMPRIEKKKSRKDEIIETGLKLNLEHSELNKKQRRIFSFPYLDLHQRQAI